ncbi:MULTISPECIES: SoxW family protein [unclassified Helicobacter]|uniref:SoxW family protein n=1 Tax=unclassified Helicobacter TaxID=2593540 RepID=UPI000CF17780|nr:MULTISPECIES: thioredoxin family protein [unclassified Helicobacter]
MKKIVYIVMTCVLFFGCKDSGVDSKSFSSGKEVSSEIQELSQSMDKKSYQGLENVFLDTGIIQTDGKYLLLVFGKNNCSYCEKLKDDLKQSQELQNYIKENFSPYYINISYDKKHHFKLNINNELKEVDIMTSQLASNIYRVFSTPTVIFGDENGKTIFEIPGYISKDKFLKVLELVVSRKWEKVEDVKKRSEMLQDILRG